MEIAFHSLNLSLMVASEVKKYQGWGRVHGKVLEYVVFLWVQVWVFILSMYKYEYISKYSSTSMSTILIIFTQT